MTKLELAVTEVGEFLHSDPCEFTDYEKARKGALEQWWHILDSIKAVKEIEGKNVQLL